MRELAELIKNYC